MYAEKKFCNGTGSFQGLWDQVRLVWPREHLWMHWNCGSAYQKTPRRRSQRDSGLCQGFSLSLGCGLPPGGWRWFSQLRLLYIDLDAVMRLARWELRLLLQRWRLARVSAVLEQPRLLVQRVEETLNLNLVMCRLCYVLEKYSQHLQEASSCVVTGTAHSPFMTAPLPTCLKQEISSEMSLQGRTGVSKTNTLIEPTWRNERTHFLKLSSHTNTHTHWAWSSACRHLGGSPRACWCGAQWAVAAAV